MTFTLIDGRSGPYPPSSRRKQLTGTAVAAGTEGAAAGTIPASIFGLTKVERCSKFVKNDNTLIVSAAPAFDGTSVLTKAAASAAPAAIPAGTYAVTVEGY